MAGLHIKKDDKVVVITGKEKGKEGKVVTAMPKNGKVVVEGVNVVTKHEKPRGQMDPGGIQKVEAAIDASNVMLVCPKCGKATRAARKILDNGTKVRVCKKCGEAIEN